MPSYWSRTVPVKSNTTIFKRICSEKDKINKKEAAGIYRINLKFEESGTEACYIGVTMNDLKFGKSITALAKIAQEEKIIINKIAEYKYKAYAFKRKALEVISTDDTCAY